jgi:1-acylglycerone phosphate reductase
MAIGSKSVLITGCSSGGIGAGLAEAFSEKGYHVFATARNPSKVPETLSQASNVTVLQLDVLSSDEIAAAVASVKDSTGGKLDVLVNNSGALMVMPLLDMSIDDGKKLFDTNFWSLISMIQAFAPLLLASGGCIVNNTSAAGVLPFGAFGSMYNTSKAAALLGSESWRLELAPLGIRTLTLVTTAVKSNAFANLKPTQIPKDSHYYSIRDYITESSDGRLQKDGITPKQYGAKVVREVEKGTTGKYWLGGSAISARLSSWLLPDSMMVRRNLCSDSAR